VTRQHSFTLIINAGGQSRRMGQPKALLPTPPANQPLLLRIYCQLHGLAQHTLVIANDSTLPQRAGLPPEVPTLPDAYPNTGPLGGIATGLAACTDWAIFVACDMPLLNPALFAWFQQRAGEQLWDAIVPVIANYPEPLHALYHVRCLPAIQARLAQGDRRANSFLPDVRVRYVPEDELRPLDPELRSFFNANTPEEWAQALVMIGEAYCV
jgi:molybdopterin-guanine dinucleotide biosynthesis protein A